MTEAELLARLRELVRDWRRAAVYLGDKGVRRHGRHSMLVCAEELENLLDEREAD